MLILGASSLTLGSLALTGCALVGKPKPLPMPVFEGPLLPKGAFFGEPPYRYKSVGVVRATKEYPTLNIEMTEELEEAYCKKAFAEAVRELLQSAKANGADGVADIHSVVFLADGRRETFDRPECTDDGAEGDVLVQGVAIQWVRTKTSGPSSAPATQPSPRAKPQTQ